MLNGGRCSTFRAGSDSSAIANAASPISAAITSAVRQPNASATRPAPIEPTKALLSIAINTRESATWRNSGAKRSPTMAKHSGIMPPDVRPPNTRAANSSSNVGAAAARNRLTVRPAMANFKMRALPSASPKAPTGNCPSANGKAKAVARYAARSGLVANSRAMAGSIGSRMRIDIADTNARIDSTARIGIGIGGGVRRRRRREWRGGKAWRVTGSWELGIARLVVRRTIPSSAARFCMAHVRIGCDSTGACREDCSEVALATCKAPDYDSGCVRCWDTFERGIAMGASVLVTWCGRKL